MIKVPANSKEKKHDFVADYEKVVYQINDKDEHSEITVRMEFLQSLLDKIEQILKPFEFEIFLQRFGLYEFRKCNGVENIYHLSKKEYLNLTAKTIPQVAEIYDMKPNSVQSKLSNVMTKIEKSKASIVVHLNGRAFDIQNE